MPPIQDETSYNFLKFIDFISLRSSSNSLVSDVSGIRYFRSRTPSHTSGFIKYRPSLNSVFNIFFIEHTQPHFLSSAEN